MVSLRDKKPDDGEGVAAAETGMTVIAIMGACVTLLAGEQFNRQDYRHYGMQKLMKFFNYTIRFKTFDEYNSPTYTVVAISELSSIYTLTQTEQAKCITMELLEIAWKMVADHFHPASKQWSGPHSRCYQTLLDRGTQSFLQIATGNALSFLPVEELEYNPE